MADTTREMMRWSDASKIGRREAIVVIQSRSKGGGDMPRIGRLFTCGIWSVRDGSEEEFATRWTALVSSARQGTEAESFLLIPDRQDQCRFSSRLAHGRIGR